MTSEQKKLVEENHNLIYSLLHQMNLNIEDYYGLAAIGLCEAAKAFNPNRGIKFSTLAYPCMRNRILQDIRKSKMAKRIGEDLYYDQEIVDNEGNAITFFALMASTENTEVRVLSRDILVHLFSDPNPRNRKIYHLLGQGYTQQEVASKVGVSQPQVSRIQKAAKQAAM